MNYYNPAEQPAMIRFMHSVSMAQPVDIYINDRPVVRGLAFRQQSPAIAVPRGMYAVKVYSTTGKLLLTQNLEVAGNQIYIITNPDHTEKLVITTMGEPAMPMHPGMMGQGCMTQEMPQMAPQNWMTQEMPQMASQSWMTQEMPQYAPKDPGMGYGLGLGMGPGYYQMTGQCPWINAETLPVQPEVTRDMPKEKAMVRLIHFSPNTPAVDVTLPNGTVLFKNIAYKGVTNYLEVAPGVYTLQVRPAGTDQVLLTVPNFKIGPNERKTIYAIGLLNGTPALEAFVLTDTRI